jgi:RNA polymerase sigma factor (sigma-70 family)
MMKEFIADGEKVLEGMPDPTAVWIESRSEQSGDDSMSRRVSGAALEEIQKLFGRGAMGAWTDSQLIDEFVGGREASEAAFRILIHRHGPMVLGVCRRILGDEHAAEDAFQATFLVLVKKAGMLRDRRLLTNWLYGVALKVSHKERARGQRRRVVERDAAEQAPRPMDDPESGELRGVIDEEIRRLPERYRIPLLLCHVEGLRHDEVARRLGCPVGTVESRLSRAREQLRSRLARRGLAPASSAIGAMLGPPEVGRVPASLIEGTVRAASESVGEASLLAAAQSWLGQARGGSPLGARIVAAGLVICTAITAVGLGLFRMEGPRPDPIAAAAHPPSVPLPDPLRTPRAVARPISGITIDGRLDDWPEDLRRYPIRNLLTSMPDGYRDRIRRDETDVEAEFMVGYDPRAGLIYLAVMVRDDEHVVHGPGRKGPGGQVRQTDAVEVYIDGTFSDRREGDWGETLDAATMPVLQYVGIAGEVPAYGDPRGANPSLVYARTRERRTRMKCRRDEEAKSTTYEWAIQAYDRFPDRITRLEPGQRIGFEIAVLDKDSGPTRSAFLTWGAPPEVFKGFDAGSLGELFLAEGP